MNVILKSSDQSKVKPTRVYAVPREIAADLRRKDRALQAMLGDFDEPATTSVRGPYLIDAADIDDHGARLLQEAGIRPERGYRALIPEDSHILETVKGDFCAYYHREIVLTRDAETAHTISRLAGRGTGSRRNRTNPLTRLGAAYVERFPAPEIRTAVPILGLFFLISLISTAGSISFIGQREWGAILFAWSFLPLIFYGVLLNLTLGSPERLGLFFSVRGAGLMASSELRKSRYTQVILCVLVLFASFGTFDSFAWWLQQNDWSADGLRLSGTGAAAFGVFTLILLAHKRFPGLLIRAILVGFILVAFAFIDSTEQTIQGRSLVFQIVPILLAGFLLVPESALVAAAGSMLLLTARTVAGGLGVNSTAYLGITLIAFLTWLIARGLENALEEVEATNRLLEEKVAERTRQLEKANKFKSEFLSQVSHELQSPIIAFSLFLKKITPLVNTPEHQALEFETRRVLEMSRAISAVAKVELDLLEQNPKLAQLDLLPHVRKVMQVFAYQAQEGGVSIAFEPQPGALLVYGNPDHLTRILHNVLSNAIKYTPGGGRVSIHAAREGDEAVLEFADSGIGIPPDDLANIFDRFTRASNAGNRPGTGLGLSMVRDMMEAMGGAIDLRSSPGKGTTVSLRFPMATPQNDSPPRGR